MHNSCALCLRKQQYAGLEWNAPLRGAISVPYWVGTLDDLSTGRPAFCSIARNMKNAVIPAEAQSAESRNP
jgi:hypothetical protein